MIIFLQKKFKKLNFNFTFMEMIKVGNVTVTLQGDSKRYEDAVKKFLKEAAKEKQK